MTTAPYVHAAPTKAADKALAERERQMRLYNVAKRAERDRLYADPAHGTRLHKFGATLNHFDIEDGDRLIEYVAREGRLWLRAAPHDIRHAAGELLSARIARIRIRAGLAEFDDPIFEDDADVRMLCRKEIGL